jgi:hypothetical protein
MLPPGGGRVFCPNCGTQNPEAAATCSKCNFALKGVVAPKFKGTMLMMNQPQIPGVTPGVPASPAPAAAGPPAPAPPVPAAFGQRPSTPGAPPGAPGMMSSKLKGTMVGVAPMALPGQSGQAPVSVPSAGAARGLKVPATPHPPAPGGHLDSGAGFSPPVAQQGVNPLGGTVAADAGGFARPFTTVSQEQPGAAPAYPTQGFPGAGASGRQGGAPQPYSPYGAPPPGTPPPGQQPVPMPYEPSAYGAPPANSYGAQPNPYGYGAYGAPPQGQQPGAMVPYGQEGMVSQPPGVGGPLRVGAMSPWLLPVSVIVGGVIVSVILSMLVSPILGLVVALLALGGGIWTLWRTLKSRSAP